MSDRNSSLSREDVVLGYRYVLNREPESEEVINEKLRIFQDVPSLRAAMISSDEFRAGTLGGVSAFCDIVHKGYTSPAPAIEYVVPDAVEARLIERTREQWTKLGEEQPYWSVLTADQFRSESITEHALADLRQSGYDAVRLVDTTLDRAGLSWPSGVCVEVGCGVGRITRPLSDRFERVIAVDISRGNIELCSRYMREEGVSNVETLLISEVGGLSALPGFDFLYSIIAFQHNPPPIQYRMLEILLEKINPRGSCLFQTGTDIPGYTFSAESYLASAVPTMEVHCLPMEVILRLMRSSGVVVQSVRMDPWLDQYGSYTFLGHKPR